MVVLANLALVGTSWRILCPYRSGFEGGGVEGAHPANARGPARGCRRREAVRGTVAGVAVSCRRMFHSVGYGDAVAGMASR
jgi:hypothetical protein